MSVHNNIFKSIVEHDCIVQNHVKLEKLLNTKNKCKPKKCKSSFSSSSSSSNTHCTNPSHDSSICTNHCSSTCNSTNKKSEEHIVIFNCEEKKYECHRYNASFHKSLMHDANNGQLKYKNDYIKLVKSLMTGNICEFEKISLADDIQNQAELKFVNPFASLAELNMDFEASQFELEECPNLSSKNFAAEMVELYCRVLVRDLPFNKYNLIDPEILEIMNDTSPYLKYINDTLITSKNIFKGIFAGELYGPFISQLLYHDIINGAFKTKQQFRVLCDENHLISNNRNEWGVTLEEAIDMQNCFKSKVLAGRAAQFYSDYKYIYNGRSLAEVVHNTPAFIFYVNAAFILSSMKVKPNPTFIQYNNQVPFITGSGGPNIQYALAEVTHLANKVAWYYKWQKFRRLRPEAAGIGIHNVINNIVSNTEYNLNNWLFNNNELLFNKIKDHNKDISGEDDQYLLSQVYPEGCPIHPAYPSGHSVIAGACATILKIFYDGNEKWDRSNYLVSHSLTGSDFTPYTGSDLNDITVGGEIDKLASNVGAGRMWAGVHYRSDNVAALLLGEKIAIEFFKKCLAMSYETSNSSNKICISFKNFKGVTVHIQPAE